MAHAHVNGHVCMMEGPDPELAALVAQSSNIGDDQLSANKEINRLQALLRQHNIAYGESSSQPRIKLGGGQTDDSEKLPLLPHEIVLQILGYAITSTATVTDPFYKDRKSNMTPEEKSARKQINVNFLATNRVFRDEGRALILKNNQIVFTQAAALVNFAKIPLPLRRKFEHITLRVVGRYYGDKAIRNFHLPMTTRYHPSVPELRIPLLARPKGFVKDHGVHAYCYTQLADFLTALKVPNLSLNGKQMKLFPFLKTMRIDLVNFVDHLSFGRMAFAPILRWHLGRFVDELMVTTSPPDPRDFELDSDFYVLRNIVKMGGLFSQGNAAFVSVEGGLKALTAYDIEHQLVFGSEVPAKAYRQPHPEGGVPPMGNPERDTVFKWTFDNSSLNNKKWVEFDRLTNEQLEDEEDFSDEDFDLDDDEDLDADEDEDKEEEDDEEDEDGDVESNPTVGELGSSPFSGISFGGSIGSADTSGMADDELPELQDLTTEEQRMEERRRQIVEKIAFHEKVKDAAPA